MDKNSRAFENKEIDLIDELARCEKAMEQYKNKYNEARKNLDKACVEMENYARILEILDQNQKKLQ